MLILINLYYLRVCIKSCLPTTRHANIYPPGAYNCLYAWLHLLGQLYPPNSYKLIPPNSPTFFYSHRVGTSTFITTHSCPVHVLSLCKYVNNQYYLPTCRNINLKYAKIEKISKYAKSLATGKKNTQWTRERCKLTTKYPQGWLLGIAELS